MTTETDTGQATSSEGTGEDTGKATPEPIVIAGKEYASQEEANKALENANATIDRLGNEVGDLRRQVTSQTKETEPEDAEPEYDPYDKNKMDKWNAWNLRQHQKATDSKRKQEEQAESNAQRSRSIQQFASDHPDIKHSDLMKVAKFADESGFTDMQTAYDRMVKKGIFSAPGQKEKEEKIEAGEEVHETLPEGGSEEDFSDLTDKQISKLTDKDPDFLGKLPYERRMAYLRSEAE